MSTRTLWIALAAFGILIVLSAVSFSSLIYNLGISANSWAGYGHASAIEMPLSPADEIMLTEVTGEYSNGVKDDPVDLASPIAACQKLIPADGERIPY